MEIYYIGGSPCSGKSTVAAELAEQHRLHYFKVDDHLDRYMQTAATDGKPCCTRVQQMSPEQIWMRDPQLQCTEELLIYEEIFEYVMDDLIRAAQEHPVITEGAALLPRLIQQRHIPLNRYLSITPTKQFQVTHYRQREWVPFVLADCSDKVKAFDNWMERDVLFARAVQQQCRDIGYLSLINDGGRSIRDMIQDTARHFGFART